MPDVILIADDLTGAADSAAPFATLDRAVRLLLDPVQRPASGVTAISTESRDLHADSARFAVREACQRLQRAGHGNEILFKKIDSTLRGHVTDELDIVLQLFGVQRLLLTPAFPSQGRTSLDGRLHVHNVPFDRSVFAGPGHNGDLRRLFRQILNLPVHHHPIDHVRGDPARLAGRFAADGIHLPDAETDIDLTRVASAALDAGITNFCGAGGLARALAAGLNGEITSRVTFRTSGPVLIVAGSMNPATQEQIDALQESGTAIAEASMPGELRLAVLTECLRSGRDAAVTTRGWDHYPRKTDDIRRTLATLVNSILSQHMPGTLVLSGGDVAAAVCRFLRAEAIILQGEAEPGIPFGVLEGGLATGLKVVTKAGGFGDREAFVRLLSSNRRQ